MMFASRAGAGILPPCPTLARPNLGCWVQFWAPRYTGGLGTPEATKVTEGLEGSWGWGCSASAGLGLQNLRGGCRGDGARLCSVVPRDRTGGNGHRLEARRLPLNIHAGGGALAQDA